MTPHDSPVPRRTLGRTGEHVSLVGLGGFHLGKPQLQDSESIRIIRMAIDNGITFLDNCWDYNEGQSEIRMGKALLDGYRHRAFLMTKIDGRDEKSAARQIDESLHRLETDYIDPLQFHEIIRVDDPDRIFAPDGALVAALEAKAAGKIRYIGFTGHKKPGHPPEDARHGRETSSPFRHGSVAAKCDGRPLRQLRKESTPGAREERDRRPRDEADGGSLHSRKQDRDAGRMPALRDESAGQRRDHRV